MNRKKKLMAILSISVILLIAGCTGTDEQQKTSLPTDHPSISENSTNLTSKMVDQDNDNDVDDGDADDNPTISETSRNKLSDNDSDDKLEGDDWCVPGQTVTKDKVNLVIKGLQDNICEAELKTATINASYKFNKAKTIDVFASTSTNSTNKSTSKKSSKNKSRSTTNTTANTTANTTNNTNNTSKT